MPTGRSWAAERRCLVVKPVGGGGPAVSRALGAAGMKVAVCGTEADALAALERDPPAVVLVAQALGPVAISNVAARAGHLHPEVPVIVLGASGTVQEAVDAMQLGASDYLAPPHDPDALVRRLSASLARAARHAPHAPGALPGIVGTSPAMRKLYAAIEKISRYKSNVLLLGESGTGKELIARALHD